MKSILLPTDFSKNSIEAIHVALELFKFQKVEFYFLHAYQNEFYDADEIISRADFDDILDSVRNQSMQQLEQLEKEMSEKFLNPNFSYHTISAYNTLLEETNLLTEAKNIDLIVMGTKGKSNERHMVFGSSTFQVLKNVHCPVLVVPSIDFKPPFDHLLFPTDYLHPYQARELALLNSLIGSNRTVVDMLHVSKDPSLSIHQEENQAIIKKWVSNTEINFYSATSKNIAKSIKNYIKNNGINLLVMVNTQHSFLEDMLFTSTLDTVSMDLKIPLLALQNSTRDHND